jgi:hypothetical protein
VNLDKLYTSAILLKAIVFFPAISVIISMTISFKRGMRFATFVSGDSSPPQHPPPPPVFSSGGAMTRPTTSLN